MPDQDMLFREAIGLATAEEMRRDETVFLMGEDVGASGGIFKCCEGLFEEFGAERVIDTPIAEAGYIGLGVGAAMTGMRPLCELMFGDFSLLTMDQIVNQAAKIRYMSGGQCKVPLTIRLSMGAGRSSAAQHSQSLHALFAHIPGLKVAIPATPRDAKGLLKTAIRDDNPVLFFEDKMMYNDSGPVPEEDDFLIPFGEAEIKREGTDLTPRRHLQHGRRRLGRGRRPCRPRARSRGRRSAHPRAAGQGDPARLSPQNRLCGGN